MKKLFALVLSLLLLFAFASCSRKPLEFNAAYTYSDPDNKFEEPLLLFKKDGNFSFSDSNDNLRMRGTYVYNEETKQLTLTSANSRYTIVLDVESKEVLRLVSFTDAEGQKTLTIPENAPFNIGDETMMSAAAADLSQTDPT